MNCAGRKGNSLTRALLVALLLIPAIMPAQEPVDRDMLARIRNEATTHSEVAAAFNQLTNVNGPRLTGSPGFKHAVD